MGGALRTSILSLGALFLVLSAARCAGCSEECSGDNQGAETCPCGSDQDCTTKLGTVLLCLEGACAIEDPPAATPELGACDDDGTCAAGLGCGIDDICFSAAECQRIEVPLVFRIGAGGGDTTGDVVTALDGCTHTWSAVSGDGTLDAVFSIDLDGNLAITSDGCEEGHWFAADRAGLLLCGTERWAISAADVTTCVDDCAAECELLDGAVGVCP